MEVAASSVMKEKAIEMKKAIDNQMTWESIVRRIRKGNEKSCKEYRKGRQKAGQTRKESGSKT